MKTQEKKAEKKTRDILVRGVSRETAGALEVMATGLRRNRNAQILEILDAAVKTWRERAK